MRTFSTLLVAAVSALLIGTGCKHDTPPTAPPSASPAPGPDGKGTPPAPKPAPAPSASAATPKRIKVAHVLISFQGAGVPGVSRSKAEAEKLGADVFDRAKKGEDFDALMKMSDDRPPSPGKYGLAVDAASKKEPSDWLRSQMVPAFGNVGFTLQVGEIGLAPYDPTTSPFGWHIIKRLE